jgi:hypothetical protein
LVGKSEGMTLIGRPRHRWEDNIKMDFKEVGNECVNWIGWEGFRDNLDAVGKKKFLPLP